MKSSIIISLPNGIQVSHIPYPSGSISHICLALGVGSINDPEGKEGLAHFFEHLCLRSVDKRKFTAIENCGGEINGFTQKDKITFEISIPTEHLEKAIDVLASIFVNTTFSGSIEKERQVILQELQEEKESEDSYIEAFHSYFYKGHSLTSPILGTEKSINSIQKTDLSQFLENNLDTNRVVLSVVSSAPDYTLQNLVEKYFSLIPCMENPGKLSIARYTPFTRTEKTENESAFVMLAFPVSSRNFVDYWTCALLLDELAGDFDGSRLNRCLRKKNGLIYHCELGYYSYGFNGMAVLSFSIDPEKVDIAMELINTEFEELSKGLSDRKLAICKRRMKGQLLVETDNKKTLSVQAAEDLLDTGSSFSLENEFKKIDMVGQYEIKISLGYFNPDRISKLIYRPE